MSPPWTVVAFWPWPPGRAGWGRDDAAAPAPRAGRAGLERDAHRPRAGAAPRRRHRGRARHRDARPRRPRPARRRARRARVAAGAPAGPRRRRRPTQRHGLRAPAARPARLPARTVLHVHDLVERVPRHWRRRTSSWRTSRPSPTAAPAHPTSSTARSTSTPRARGAAVASPRPAVVGFVGRLEPRKGLLDFVRAAPPSPPSPARSCSSATTPSAPIRATRVGARRARRTSSTTAGSTTRPGVMRHLDVLVLPSTPSRSARSWPRRWPRARPWWPPRRRSARGRDRRRDRRARPPGRPDALAEARRCARPVRADGRGRPRGGRAVLQTRCLRVERYRGAAIGRRGMRVAFDSPPRGRPARHRPLRALPARRAARDRRDGHEIVEAHRPRGADVFHSPWIDGARCAPPARRS